MKKFNFNLKNVLMLRKRQQEHAQKQLFIAEEKLKSIEELLRKIENECELLEKELQEKQKSSQKVAAIREYFLYLQNLRRSISEHQDEILKAQNFMEIKRQELNEATQRKKIMENIKEKQYEEWKESYRKLEIKLIDEMATLRHIQQKEGLTHES